MPYHVNAVYSVSKPIQCFDQPTLSAFALLIQAISKGVRVVSSSIFLKKGGEGQNTGTVLLERVDLVLFTQQSTLDMLHMRTHEAATQHYDSSLSHNTMTHHYHTTL